MPDVRDSGGENTHKSMIQHHSHQSIHT